MNSIRCNLFLCMRCGETKSHPLDSFTTGYGITEEGELHCFACCALDDREEMDGWDKSKGPYMMYYTGPLGEERVVNWPESLSYPTFDDEQIRVRSVKHYGGTYAATKFKFKDHKGRVWGGINCPDTHCMLAKCWPLEG